MTSSRQKVTPEQVHLAYDKAKYVYENPGTITKAAAANELHSEHKINEGTAKDFIRIFQHLRKGSVFKRALSEYAMDYFLFNINRDYSNDDLQTSLSALMKHIVYREEGNPKTGRKPVSQHAMRRLHRKYLMIINNSKSESSQLSDEAEQEAVHEKTYSTYRDKIDLKRAIEEYANYPLEVITISNTLFKRNNVAIALIKRYRNYKCQICKISIKKADGSEYIEAAHIEPHSQAGRATLHNIILLCPNHHKEFDLGKTDVRYANNRDFVEITLNGKTHKLLLH
ncbi:HNH endonuclease [Hymenobacter sp. HSC-4F20]|uniref:HNH endonuclease n=1 Tax=Hymenobacter sp. HSC-4F20 TaxID=2864135 RepID=UPI001C73AD56|nr:HNH endonuclease [Hymenobacter sp. HSC-4F20]MBX0288866.1 HNH endonuclease [Hymenobacter sp. HSC-4F20]